jgi:hypothetical protein
MKCAKVLDTSDRIATTRIPKILSQRAIDGNSDAPEGKNEKDSDSGQEIRGLR